MLDIDRRDRWNALRLVGVQALAVLLLALAGCPFGAERALALLAGGLVGIAGSAWLAFFAFWPSGASSAKAVVASFYLGELGKMLLLASLFVVIFRNYSWLQQPVNALLVFAAFMESQLAAVVGVRLLQR